MGDLTETKVSNLPGVIWKKPRKSGPNGGNCVGVTFTEGKVAVRHTKSDDTGAVLLYTQAEWEAFLDGARKGEFNLDTLAA